MAITAKMVKELREMTGAGMMDCKKALTATDGNMDEAVEFLRKNGEAKAVKKAGRIAAEGLVMAEVKDDKSAAIVEVNSETDFVAKNDEFRTFVADVVAQAIATKTTKMDEFMAETWNADPAMTVKEALVAKIARIGEKLDIRRYEKIESADGVVVSYIHAGGRIGVLVEAQAANTDENKEALKNIAMQIAAMNPQYICRADISAEEMAKLREITVDSSLNDPASLPKPVLKGLLEKAVSEKLWSDEDLATYEEQKNNKFLFNFLSKEAIAKLVELAMAAKEDILTNKIFNGAVEGRISKQVKDISLYDQVYVKAEDGKQTVEKYLKSVDKDLKVVKFVRFETGEGIEKKQEDFAAEVAAQMNK